MREDDSRKDCVIYAKTAKDVYNCVRSSETNKLTLKCGTTKKQKKTPVMKCGATKCGNGM